MRFFLHFQRLQKISIGKYCFNERCLHWHFVSFFIPVQRFFLNRKAFHWKNITKAVVQYILKDEYGNIIRVLSDMHKFLL